MIEVSVVIPTHNRAESLRRCLHALATQQYPLREVIVVDSSDQPLDERQWTQRFHSLPLTIVRSPASVCAQRNKGIRLATGTHVQLCDDDIVLPPAYVATLVGFMTTNPECGAASGRVYERTNGRFVDFTEQTLGAFPLLWKFLFQLTVWADVDSAHHAGPLLSAVRKFYRSRGNTWTFAGWPLLTQVRGESFRTSVFGLGAALIRRDWLLASPFDEILDPHGIGDNYGVAMGFPEELPMHVLRTTTAQHHREEASRLAATTVYYRRVLALHYFLGRFTKFTVFNRMMLIWSLIGNLIPQFLKLDFRRAYATCKAGAIICAGRNPYARAAKAGCTGPITPNL